MGNIEEIGKKLGGRQKKANYMGTSSTLPKNQISDCGSIETFCTSVFTAIKFEIVCIKIMFNGIKI